jgi:hypothetical protein
MGKKDRVRNKKLQAMTAEFHELLRLCLPLCANGRWGLFGQNDFADPEGRYWTWPEAKRVKELAFLIEVDNREMNRHDAECERFLELCRNLHSNTPGEPKLAQAFLEELETAIQ